MSVWIKCLCTFLLAVCMCSFFDRLADARESAIQIGEEDSTEQMPNGLGLLKAAKGITGILEEAASPMKELPVPRLGDTIDQAKIITENVVNSVLQTTAAVPENAGVVRNGLGSIRFPEERLPSGQNPTGTINAAPGIVHTAASASVQTVETSTDKTGHIVDSAVSSTHRLLFLPVLLDKLGDASIVGGVVDGVGSTVGGVVDGVGSTVGGVVDGVGSTVGGVVDGVGSTVGGVADGVGSTVGGVADGVGSTVGGVADGVGSTVGGVVDGVGSTVGGVVDGVGSTVGGVVDGVGSTVGGVVDGVGSTVGGVVDGVGSTVGGVVDGVGSTVGGVVDGVGSTVGGVVDDVGSTVDELIGSKPDKGGPPVSPKPPEIEEHVDIPVDREPSDTDKVRDPPVEQGKGTVDADRDNPPTDQGHNRANEELDDTPARHETSNSNGELAVNQHRSRQHTGYSNSTNKTDNIGSFIPDSQPSSDNTIAFDEQHPAQNAKSEIPVCCTAHPKPPAEEPFKNGGVQPSTALKTAIPDKSNAPLPVHKNEIPIAPPVTFSVKQPVQSKSGSAGGGPQLTGGKDAILAESISIKLASRRIYAKNTRQLITKWANEPPNKPPRNFLFSTMN